MKKSVWIFVTAGLILSSLVVFGYMAYAKTQRVRYITFDSLEPDIWASVWVIKNRIAPNSEVIVRQRGAPMDDGIAFGIDDGQYKRTGADSVYETLIKSTAMHDIALVKLGKIMHDIEITPWASSMQESGVVENNFRTLQERFTDRVVPVECYARFFDITYRLLADNKPTTKWDELGSFVNSNDACGDAKTVAMRDTRPVVRHVEIAQVLDTIGAGKKVIFVDAREESEYNEFHIPGAMRMSLRDVNASVLPQFEGAELVIGYCIKDFRGFELARALASVGVKNTATMKPYGISGWMAAKLPTTGKNGLTEQMAIAQLNECATGVKQCL